MNYSNPSKAEWRRRVNENCKACIYDPYAEGNWRQQVTMCTALSCPIWEIRPITSKTADPLPRNPMDDALVDASTIEKGIGQISSGGEAELVEGAYS